MTDVAGHQDTSPPLVTDTVSDRERWEFERKLREHEADLRAKEVRRSQWSNPLVLAVLGAALAGGANFYIAKANGEQALVLEAIRTNGDVRKSAQNLEFLVKTGLLSNEDLGKGITQYLKEAPAPTLAAAGGSAASALAQGPAPRFDFEVLNKQAINPAGWDIDVFSCTENGAQAETARAFASLLASRADTGTRLGDARIGRIRFDASQDHMRTGSQIFYDREEITIARIIEREAEAGRQPFDLLPNNERSTPSYVSVYFCTASQ
jgi:hypothetical protein